MPRNGCDRRRTDNFGAVSANSDGCIYPDEVIMKKGVSFSVSYTGCVEVKTSMKLLGFETRTQVARECINRVCEAAGLKSSGKRRIDKKLQSYISDQATMQNAGTNAIINVSSHALTLINAETREIIANHNMPRISFASGGDNDTYDFLAYIAKNEDDWRACYVLECASGQSEDLIVTIGKAFELRFNAMKGLTNNPGLINSSNCSDNTKEYYNDLPNKLPPDFLTVENKITPQMQQQSQIPSSLNKSHNRLSSNLIDLNSPPVEETKNKFGLSIFDPLKNSYDASAMPMRDVFDTPPCSLTAEVQRSQLNAESWFHAGISRPASERMLQHDGDFLVRESQGKQGQYVLTGRDGKMAKHLLLIDPEGLVRTKDRMFDSISHLINYHWTNSLPIISEDSALLLRNPVRRQTNEQKQKQRNSWETH